MPTTRGAYEWVDLSYMPFVANTNRIVSRPAPCAGTIKSVLIGVKTLLTTGGGILAVAKGSASILSSASYNIGAAGDLVADTFEAATLTTAPTTLRVAAYDTLNATWTLTTAASTHSPFVCLIAIEPDTW
jgi:hypothetical protein